MNCSLKLILAVPVDINGLSIHVHADMQSIILFYSLYDIVISKKSWEKNYIKNNILK